jgi:hypothetical protein
MYRVELPELLILLDQLQTFWLCGTARLAS